MTSATTSGARTVAELAGAAADRYRDGLAMRFKRDGAWRDLTFAELGARVEQLALGLVELGIEQGDRVCILADTRPEWTMASLAISAAGGVVVPIYATNSPQECEWVAGNSGARAVVCENTEQLAKIEQVRGSLPALRHTIGMEPGAGETTVDELATRGRAGDREELARRQAAVELENAYTFIYTSGTTGPPKGCVLTHRNAMTVGQLIEEIGFVSRDDLVYLYLPMAHVFALTAMLGALDVGTAVIYFGGDTQKIVEELRETKPTYVPSVPRIFEKIYAQVTAGVDPEQLRQAVTLGTQVREMQAAGRPIPDELREAFERTDAALYSKVRAAFGGRVRQAVTGAAPIAPDILRFFHACGVPVLEGWGMTETTGVGTVNTLDSWKIGTVGRALPGVEVRIAEEDGEILLRGPNLFREYWQNPEATASTIVDGWLHTGDIGHLDEDGYLSITGRKKDIIITAGGKNLAPANLENDLKQSPWISQAVMHGDRRPYPVALITLDPEEIIPWARQHGLPEDVAGLSRHEHVRALIQGELDRANANYAKVEQIKKFTILDHDLSQESGELTPTLKVKRNVIEDKYAGLFDAMYR